MPSQSQPSRHRPQTASSSSSPVPPARDPEYIAIVLAATQGRRLFPLTSEYPDGVPKHLLPVSPLNGCDAGRGGAGGGGGAGGATLLRRLLTRTHESGFEMMVVAIHAEDRATIPSLLGTDGKTGPCRPLGGENASLLATVMLGGDDDDIVTDLEFHGDVVIRSPSTSSNSSKKQQQQQQPSSSSSSANDERTRRCMHVRVVRLPEGCDGSADALRFLSSRGSIDDDEGNGGGGGGESSSSPATSESRDERNDGTNDSDDRRRRSIIPRTSHAVIMPGDLIAEAALLSSSSSSTTDTDVLSLLVQAHRRWNAGPAGSAGAACTMLLADAGAEDKEGVPLKESSKAKMGLFSREEEDMEYVGLSSEVPPPPSASLASLSHSSKHLEAHATPSRRVVLKRSKLEVEEDEGTGSTPKLVVPKRRLHSAGRDHRRRGGKGRGAMSSTATVDRSPAISLRTDLHDVHLYAISNWVFELIHARPNMQSFQGEVLPLLISRQYRGVEAAFGPTAWKEERNRERLRKVLKDLDGTAEENGRVSCDKVAALLGMYASGKMSGGLGGFLPADDDDDDHGAPNPADELGGSTPKAVDDPAASAAGSSLLSPPFPSTRRAYAVSAQVLSREASSLTLRASTLPSLLYGCGAVTRRTLGLDPSASSSLVAEGTTLSAKFDSVLAPSCAVGEKVQTKGCTVVGDGVSLGDRARLNNVVVMDGVAVGNNTVLQNSLVGANARIGDNCNLRDCQVGPGAVVPSGTKTTEKGEAFHV